MNPAFRLLCGSMRSALLPLSLLVLTMSALSRGASALAAAPRLLEGKTVLVTGGGRGIGRAIALICHGQGANVVVTARTEGELQETVRLAQSASGSSDGDGEASQQQQQQEQRLKQSARAAALLSRRAGTPRAGAASVKATSVGARRVGAASQARTAGPSSVARLVDAVKTGSSSLAAVATTAPRISYRVCDVTDEAQVDSVIRDLVAGTDPEAAPGGIDILVNNAGGSQSPKGPVGTLENSDLERLLKLNVVGPQLVTAAVCRHDPSWQSREATEDAPGRVILNISSKAGKVGLENYSFYAATKFALEGLTSCWSKELRSRNVRVHSLSPGMINTQSFPKPPGKAGVREASSIRDCLVLALTGRVVAKDAAAAEGGEAVVTTVVEDMMEYTGHYIHVDEYDQAVNAWGLTEAHRAFKAIDETAFSI